MLFQSCDNEIFCWRPGCLPSDEKFAQKSKDNFVRIARLKVEYCGYFFTRFAINHNSSILALGNSVGHVRLFDLYVDDPMKIPYVTLMHPKRKNNVRDLSFSRCGRDLVFSMDDGTIWLYQHK